MITLEQLKKVLDDHFSAPFLKQGTVTTKWIEYDGKKPRNLQVRIGRRDVWIDETGHITGAGTSICDPAI